ncbi:MAG: hypothetical protein AB7G93_21005 [Bdellovibrionales bacterium]
MSQLFPRPRAVIFSLTALLILFQNCSEYRTKRHIENPTTGVTGSSLQVQSFASAHKIHVSDFTGHDENSGTATSPYRTLERALRSVKSLHESQSPPQSVEILIHKGTYFLKETLVIDRSVTVGRPFRMAAASGETVVISGGTSITGWTRYRENIYRASTHGLEFLHLFSDAPKE